MELIIYNSQTIQDLPPTRRSAVLTQPASAKFTTHESRARVAYHLAAILALVHFVTSSTVKCIASIADPNLVVSLEFVAPMASCYLIMLFYCM